MPDIKEKLKALPIALNCYYGDPTLQWQDTVAKVKMLAKDHHRGPVGIITKGKISVAMARELARFNLPGLIVIVSISELPAGFEKVGHRHRYQTIANCQAARVKVFAAVRPLTPPYNTSPEIITRIFHNLKQVNCQTACVSGFRGDADMIKAVNPANSTQWVLRVKQMTGLDQILKIAAKYNIKVFTRMSCTVSYILKRAGTYNPYWGSPQLVRCQKINCPMIETCGPINPDPKTMAWLREIGYDLTWEPAPRAVCEYSSDTRLHCKSCCTTCFVQKQPRVIVKNARTLGDLTFCRFILGGTLCVKPNMIDGGAKDVGHVKIIQDQVGFPVHSINTWFVWANQLNKCFDCKYCISKYYPNKGPIGCLPSQLADLLNTNLCLAKKNLSPANRLAPMPANIVS